MTFDLPEVKRIFFGSFHKVLEGSGRTETLLPKDLACPQVLKQICPYKSRVQVPGTSPRTGPPTWAHLVHFTEGKEGQQGGGGPEPYATAWPGLWEPVSLSGTRGRGPLQGAALRGLQEGGREAHQGGRQPSCLWLCHAGEAGQGPGPPRRLGHGELGFVLPGSQGWGLADCPAEPQSPTACRPDLQLQLQTLQLLCSDTWAEGDRCCELPASVGGCVPSTD